MYTLGLHSQILGSIDGEKPVLVFLHEGLGSLPQWKDFPLSLAQQTGLSAFLYEREGHGKSPPASEKRTPFYLHKEAVILDDVLQQAGILHPIFVGHSDGGTIALLFQSDKIKPMGIVTLAAHVFVEEVTLQGIQKAVELYQSTSLPEKLKKHHFDNTDSLFWAWADTWLSPEFRNWNIEKEISQVNCPLLALQGETDEYATALQLEAIAKGVSGPVQTKLIPNCAHSPHLESKEIVTKIISNFIQQVLSKGLS